jgi:hypothetical protein
MCSSRGTGHSSFRKRSMLTRSALAMGPPLPPTMLWIAVPRPMRSVLAAIQ